MKNVTVSLEDDLVLQARIKAARSGKSLSKYMADLVTSDVTSEALPGTPDTRQAQIEALERILKGPKWSIMRAGRMPTSDERNER